MVMPFNWKILLISLCLALVLNSRLVHAQEIYSTPKQTEEAARLFMFYSKFDQAAAVVDTGLKTFPQDYQLNMTRAELFERNKEFIKAIKVYDYVLELRPGNRAAMDLKLRALMDMGVNTVSLKKMLDDQGINPLFIQRARGNIAMNHIRWDEPLKALEMIRQKEIKDKSEYRKSNAAKISVDETLTDQDRLRSRWDKVLALHGANQFKEVIQEYEMAQEDGLETPLWIKEAAADSYIYFRQPRKALELYRSVLRKNPESFKTRMGYYYALVDLGRYKEAQQILNDQERELPSRVKDRGVLSDNWAKAEVAYNKVWILIYQDRLNDAQNMLKRYITEASSNISLRVALAHLYSFRGWPRKAKTEFEIIQTLDPLSVANSNGYSRNLYDNAFKAQGRELIKRLSQEHSYNRHVSRTKRLIEVEDMGLLTLNAYYSDDHPGESEFYLSLRGDQPVSEHNTLFAELIRRETAQTGTNDVTDRFYLGDIYRPNNTWKLTGALSGDSRRGDSFGFLGDVTMTPGDYWTHTLSYDSRTIDVPLRSRSEGIDVKSYSYKTIYRHSELFNTSLGVNLKDFEDGNDNYSYLWTTDTAVTTGAYWRTRLGTEFSYSTYSKQDVSYFSPENIYAFYLIPNVEHVWYRRYEKALVDRLYLGLGRQWQKNFGADPVGFIRYEIDYRHSDTLSILLGTVYSLRYYDGNDVNNMNVYTTLRKRF